jgi:hypothetical protein
MLFFLQVDQALSTHEWWWWVLTYVRDAQLGQRLDFSGDVPDLKRFIAVLKKTSRLNESELEMILERFRQIALLIPED